MGRPAIVENDRAIAQLQSEVLHRLRHELGGLEKRNGSHEPGVMQRELQNQIQTIDAFNPQQLLLWLTTFKQNLDSLELHITDKQKVSIIEQRYAHALLVALSPILRQFEWGNDFMNMALTAHLRAVQQSMDTFTF